MSRPIRNNFQVQAQQRLREIALSLQLEPRPLADKGHGVQYNNYLSHTILTVYDHPGALDEGNADGVEVAISPRNVEEEYGIDAQEVSFWVEKIYQKVGHFAKPKTSWKYPRIGLRSTQDVEAFAKELRAFLDVERQGAEGSKPSQNQTPTVDEKTLAKIWARRGQADFRSNLLRAYQGRCAVTGCPDADVLEAAHITPYQEEQTYDLQNGLLLRADIHTLFDLFLISIDPRDGRVVVASRLSRFYQELAGRQVDLPTDENAMPAPDRLMEHFKNWRVLNG